MKEDPPLSIKCKDKFLVQSTPIPPGMEANDVVSNHLVAWEILAVNLIHPPFTTVDCGRSG